MSNFDKLLWLESPAARPTLASARRQREWPVVGDLPAADQRADKGWRSGSCRYTGCLPRVACGSTRSSWPRELMSSLVKTL